jgi:NADPH:quinone reductase-like Zn-dependent oxidoreductase
MHTVRLYHWSDTIVSRLKLSLDFYEKIPKGVHIIGVDGAGTVLQVGSGVRYFKPGDEVFYGASPVGQGAASERYLVDERMTSHLPKSWDHVQSACLPVTAGTAYEALLERLEIKKDEHVGLLIINGAGGVGSMASQIARSVLNLPVIVSTAGRPETIAWCKEMGSTHVIDHHQDLQSQIAALELEVPIK